MKTCWYKVIIGGIPDKDECIRQLAYGGCEMCNFYLEEPQKPEPGHENDKDELPY